MMHEQLLPQAPQLPVPYPGGDNGDLAAEQSDSDSPDESDAED